MAPPDLNLFNNSQVHIVARTNASAPVHMDIANATQDLKSLYDVFVDLYLMSLGRCLSYNLGGFGKWAQLISGQDLTCNIRFWTKGVDKKSAHKSCKWNEPANFSEYVPPFQLIQTPLFLPPMD